MSTIWQRSAVITVVLSGLSCGPDQLEVYAKLRNGSATIKWSGITINPASQPWFEFDDAEQWPALALSADEHQLNSEPELVATGNPVEQHYNRIYLNATNITTDEVELVDIMEPIAYPFEHKSHRPQQILVTCLIQDSPQGRAMFVIDAERY